MSWRGDLEMLCREGGLFDGEKLVVHTVKESEGCVEEERMGLWPLCEEKGQ